MMGYYKPRFLPILVFFIDGIKGKQTKDINKHKTTRRLELLELIHTDICGYFPTLCYNVQKYFITFIDNFTRYGYIYLLYEESESLKAFEIYKDEIEKQLDIK